MKRLSFIALCFLALQGFSQWKQKINPVTGRMDLVTDTAWINGRIDLNSNTWVRDTTNLELRVANESDKIKEVLTKERQKKGYITFSFDDGFDSDYDLMRPLFKAKGAVATTNIIASIVGNTGILTWSEIDSLAADGWEICSHGMSAGRMDTMSAANIYYNMSASKDTLAAHGHDVEVFVYPGGRYGDTALMYARELYRAARSIIMYSPSPVELNPYQINSDVLKTFALTSVIADDPADSTEMYNLIDSVAQLNQWLILYIHETESADSAIIARYIDYIQAKGDSLKIVTISQALDNVGNQADFSHGVAINNDDIRVDGIIYKDFYPFIYTPGDTSEIDGYNLFIGEHAGNISLSSGGGASTLASRNNGLGYKALSSLTTGYGNNAMGASALEKNTTGYNNIAIGGNALTFNTQGYACTAIGFGALSQQTTANQNTAVGYGSGYYGSGSNNSFFGTNAGYGASSGCTGQMNVAVGTLSMEKYTGADGNTAVGYGSLNSLTSGDYNTAVGTSSGGALTTGGQHTMIGYRAGRYDVTTNANVIVGADAGYGVNGSSTYGYSTIVGYKAGYSLTTGNYNTLLGYNAGYSCASGSGNVMLGYRAGYSETGSYKTYIAHDSTSWANGMATASKLMWYSDASDADKANHFINLFGKVAIGEAKALSAYSLEVIGNANITTSCKLGTFLQLTPTADPPGSPAEGMVYSDTDHHIYYYNGSAWIQLDN